MIKSIISLSFTIALVWALNTSLELGSSRIPPLGKFLDPFHGFWQNAFENKANQELKLEGLTGKVTVFTDSLGIPHLFAENETDLYLAQGYITARDRLWQMEFQTHAAAGRISEVLGKGPNSGFLNYDRSQRRLGLAKGAERFLKVLESDKQMLAIITSYTQGINQYINNLSYEDYPLEYKLLDYSPEEWTILKCGLVQKNLSQTLNIGDKDIEMTNALKLLGKDVVDLLFPNYEGVADPIVDNTGKWNFNPIKLDSVPLAVPDEYINIKQTVQKPAENIGSNNWAVSGKKTATGAPILCNDPHLNITLPSIWYSIHLNSPGMNVMGVSAPGHPLVVIGFNDSIAWGVTNAQRDVVDWYKVQFKNGSRDEYLSDGKWKKAFKVVESFKVKGDEIFYDTVVYTHHGPIVYDQNFHGDSNWNQLAFRWVAHDPANEAKTLYLLNKANNHTDYLNALDYLTGPAQNFAFASVRGDIAMRIQGKYPVRRLNEGRFVLDGTKTTSEWKAFIPNDQNVQYKNPERGFVSSANQYPADATYPYYINATSYEAYRNRRINQRLQEMNNITPQDMMALQQDNYSIKAAELLPTLLSVADSGAYSPDESQALEILRQWNYENNADAQGPIYFEAWYKNLYALLWDELENQAMELPNPTAFTTIKFIRESKPNFAYFDKVSTPEKETRKDIVIESFKKAVADINEWKAKGEPFDWAHYKGTTIEHLLKLGTFAKAAYNGGNRESVNATTKKDGPSWRMVVSLEKSGVKAWGVYPGGQSGNPGSRFYSNFVDEWESGKYFALWFSSKKEDYSQVLSKTTLNP